MMAELMVIPNEIGIYFNNISTRVSCEVEWGRNEV